MIDIKPCPYCGSSKVSLGDFRGTIYVECGDCTYLSKHCSTEAEAIAAHNGITGMREALEEIAERGCHWLSDPSFTPVGTCLETDPEGLESPPCASCIATAALEVQS